MKNKKFLLITLLAVCLTLTVFVFSAFAEETEEYAGSDLPVSESYVLRAIGALEERIYDKIDTMIEALSERLDAVQEKLDAVQNTPSEPTSASVDYTVVFLENGQSIVGSCELILRSGTAVALCPGLNGISDLTAGADLPDAVPIDANHLLLVPRDDGRGITVTSAAGAYIMVRGTYQITDPAAE